MAVRSTLVRRSRYPYRRRWTTLYEDELQSELQPEVSKVISPARTSTSVLE